MKIFRVLSDEYRDSLVLMKMSSDVSRWSGVNQSMIMMGTENNRKFLKQVGFDSVDTDSATANDLVIAIELDDQSYSSDILAKLDTLFAQPDQGEKSEELLPDLAAALRENSEFNLVSISTPGEVAVVQARQALEAGKHVFCFSHHIPVEAEIGLKDLAIQKQLLMMGPDCGTSILDGVGLGFANRVRKGSIGIVSASGSGLQEVISLIHRSGAGISQAIGVGGRDLTSPVNGRMAEQALLRIAQQPQTEVIILLAKKVSPGAEQRLLKAAARINLPIIAQFRGLKPTNEQDGGIPSLLVASTYEECAKFAVQLTGAQWLIPEGTDRSAKWMDGIVPSIDPGRSFLRGLFAGGSLCAEANYILTGSGLAIRTNLDAPIEAKTNTHILLDLGSEEYTEGRAHPFIDHRLRALEIDKAFADPSVGILLVDVVLGWGCHADPSGELVAALTKARLKHGRGPAVIASVCGTCEDIQNYDLQRKQLEEHGVFVAESNAAAALLTRDLLVRMVGRSGSAKEAPNRVDPLIKGGLNIINIGLPIFMEGPQSAGAQVVSFRSRPDPVISDNIKNLLDGLL